MSAVPGAPGSPADGRLLARRLWFRPDSPDGPSDSVDCCVCLSADGSLVVRAEGDRLFALDEEQRTVWTATVPAGGAGRVVWSPGGEVVVLAGGTVAVHDGDTGVVRGTAAHQPPALAPAAPGTGCLAVCGDGLRLAYPAPGAVVVRHRSGTGPTQRLPVSGTVTDLAWDATGRLLCVATTDGLQWWNPALGLMNRPPLGGRARLSAVACSPAHATVAFADAEGVHLLDQSAGAPRASAAVGSPVHALAFSRTGRHLVAAATDRVLVFLDHGLGRSVSLPVAPHSAGDFSMSACGRFLVRGEQHGASGTGLWELTDAAEQPLGRRPAARLRRWAAAMCASVGRALPSPGDTAPAVGPPTVLAPPGGGPAAPGFAWVGDGRYVHESRPGSLTARHPGARDKLWTADVPTGPAGAHDLEVSPVAGGSLAVASRAGVAPVAVVSPRRGIIRTSVPGGQAPVWSPVDADRLVVPEPGPSPTHLYLHDVSTGTRLLSRPVHAGVGRPAWSPDGRLLAAGTRGGVLLWRMPDFSRTPPVLPLSGGAFATRVAWSPDGSRLAVTPAAGQGPLTVWDTGSWHIQRELGQPGGVGWAPALAWSPDGALLAAPGPGEHTALVQIWDVGAAAVVLTLEPPTSIPGHLWSVRWSPDDRRLATTYRGGTTLLWEMRTRSGGTQAAGMPAGAARGGRAQSSGTAAALPEPGTTTTEDGGFAAAAPGTLPLPPAVLASLGSAAAAAGAATPLSTLAELALLLAPLWPEDAGVPRPHDGRAAAALRSLAWPPSARAALIAVVAAQLPPCPRFAPPANARPSELRDALDWGLGGTSVPPVTARPHERDLAAALERTRTDLLPTLRLLGPDAVARDPALALVLTRALVRNSEGTPAARRRAAGSHRSAPAGDEVDGPAAAGVPAELVRHGPPDRLVPSQLVLPDDVLTGLAAQDALLYRTRRGTAPEAASGSAVLVLDTGPAAQGQVGTCLRVCAHLLADGLLRAGRGVELLHLWSTEVSRRLLRPTDLRHLWLPGPPAASPQTHRAQTERRVTSALDRLGDGGAAATPRAVLLTHPYEARLNVPGALALRVHYPGHPVRTGEPDCWMLSPTERPERLRAVVDAVLAAL
ncbi:hypothetical protein ACWEQ7_33655 [Streptomyces sp. NPDC004069]